MTNCSAHNGTYLRSNYTCLHDVTARNVTSSLLAPAAADAVISPTDDFFQ